MSESTTPPREPNPLPQLSTSRVPSLAPASDSREVGAASPNTDSHRSPTGATVAPRTAAKRRPEEQHDLESFVALAYARMGKKIVMSKKTAIAIAQSEPPDEDLCGRLSELARKDILLAVPKQLLLSGLPYKAVPKAWSRVREVCGLALRLHPASSELASVLAAASQGGDGPDKVLEHISRLNCSSLAHPRDNKSLSRGQVRTLRTNLTDTAALWMTAVCGIDSQLVIRSLHEHIWGEESRRMKSLAEKWRRLLLVRDTGSLGLACDAFVLAAEQLRGDAESARTGETAALRRAADAESHLTQLTAQLGLEQQANADLRKRLHEAARDHEVAISHHRDDFERLRSRVLRRLSREAELLDEGMLAIRRETPKLHVMIDHGDRALCGLREEIKALQLEVRQ
jgi:hypothetical protein